MTSLSLSRFIVTPMAFVLVAALLALPGTVLAQDDVAADSSEEESLPDPGLTPSHPFYFLESFVERFQDALTFNAEAKARRQLQRALERVAEVNAELGEHGVEAPGVEKALKRLEENRAKIVDILETRQDEFAQRAENFAAELEERMDRREAKLQEVFADHEEELSTRLQERRDELLDQLEVAVEAGDQGQIEALHNEIDAVEEQMDNRLSAVADRRRAALERLQEHEGRMRRHLSEDLRIVDQEKEELEEAMFERRHAVFDAHVDEMFSLQEARQALLERLQFATEEGEEVSRDVIRAQLRDMKDILPERREQHKEERRRSRPDDVHECFVSDDVPEGAAEFRGPTQEVIEACLKRIRDQREAFFDRVEDETQALEHRREEALDRAFEERERAFNHREAVLRRQLQEARVRGDEEAVAALERALQNLAEQRKRMQEQEDEVHRTIEEQEDRRERAVEQMKERAEEFEQRMREGTERAGEQFNEVREQFENRQERSRLFQPTERIFRERQQELDRSRR